MNILRREEVDKSFAVQFALKKLKTVQYRNKLAHVVNYIYDCTTFVKLAIAEVIHNKLHLLNKDKLYYQCEATHTPEHSNNGSIGMGICDEYVCENDFKIIELKKDICPIKF